MRFSLLVTLAVLAHAVQPLWAQETAPPKTPPDSLTISSGTNAPPSPLLRGVTGFPTFEWQPPLGRSDLPRWKVGWTGVLAAPGGMQFSASFFGRKGDPFPLFMSENLVPAAGAFSGAGPGSYRLQMDLKLGVSAPIIKRDGFEMRAFGDIFIPASRGEPRDPAATLLNSPVFRAGIRTIF